jgi:hypothetical protein
VFGEKMVMRIFDPDVVVKTLPELGFPLNDAKRWDNLTKNRTALFSSPGRPAQEKPQRCTPHSKRWPHPM